MHREIILDNLATAEIFPNNPIEVNHKCSWNIKITIGEKGIKKGGQIRVTIPHGFSLPQDKAFFDPGFITVESPSDDLDLSLNVVSDIFCRWDLTTGHSGAWGRNIFITINNRNVKEGEEILLKYGNKDYYGEESFSKTGAFSRELSGDATFIIAIDPIGDKSQSFSGFIRLNKFPSIEVLPGPIHNEKLILKSNILISSSKEKEYFGLIMEIDEFNNPISTKKIKTNELKHDTENNYFYTSTNRGKVKSNPLFKSKEEKKDFLKDNNLYWGDIHGHTIHSDGLGTTDQYYSFAKDIAFLDFSAITDHDDIGPRLYKEEWELMKKKSKSYNHSNKFVSFLGQEYRNGKCDMNIYYPHDCASILYGNDEKFKNSSALTKEVKKNSGMIIPHMHFGADWSGYNHEVYRVMEIYSSHGSAEYKGCKREIPYLRKQVQKSSESNPNTYFHNALNLGYKLGVTAGSDTHSGRPGFSDWTRVTRTYLGGLTAIIAKDLSRQSLWNALYNRRCYATTGNRSLLKFSINGQIMGSKISIEENSSIIIEFSCIPDGKLKSFTLYKSGKILLSEKIQTTMHNRFLEEKCENSTNWYYIRYDLEFDEMIWSSPIWIV